MAIRDCSLQPPNQHCYCVIPVRLLTSDALYLQSGNKAVRLVRFTLILFSSSRTLFLEVSSVLERDGAVVLLPLPPKLGREPQLGASRGVWEHSCLGGDLEEGEFQAEVDSIGGYQMSHSYFVIIFRVQQVSSDSILIFHRMRLNGFEMMVKLERRRLIEDHLCYQFAVTEVLHWDD